MAIVALMALACTGPRPAVEDVQLRAPATPGAPYEVIVDVVNQGSGSGQIEVNCRLLDGEAKRTAAETSRTIDLAPHERISLTLLLRPAGPGPYRAVAEVRYPVD